VAGQTKQERELRKGQEKLLKQLRSGKADEIERQQQERDASAEQLSQKYTERLTVNVVDDYDRFKDLTAVQLRPMLVFGGGMTPIIYGIARFYLTAGFTYQGKQKIKPDTISVAFETLEAGREFGSASQRRLILLVDNERLDLGTTNHDELEGGERLFLNLPYDVFLKVATAKTVEAQLGRLEFRLNAKHLAGLRALIGLETDAQATATTDDQALTATSNLLSSVKNITDVTDTVWQCAIYHHDWTAEINGQATFKFSAGGDLRIIAKSPGLVKGFLSDRNGIWRQEGDAIYLYVPKNSEGELLVGVGIIRNNKVIGLLYYQATLALQFVGVPTS
jgi:hypothetical protein